MQTSQKLLSPAEVAATIRQWQALHPLPHQSEGSSPHIINGQQDFQPPQSSSFPAVSPLPAPFPVSSDFNAALTTVHSEPALWSSPTPRRMVDPTAASSAFLNHFEPTVMSSTPRPTPPVDLSRQRVVPSVAPQQAQQQQLLIPQAEIEATESSLQQNASPSPSFSSSAPRPSEGSTVKAAVTKNTAKAVQKSGTAAADGKKKTTSITPTKVSAKDSGTQADDLCVPPPPELHATAPSNASSKINKGNSPLDREEETRKRVDSEQPEEERVLLHADDVSLWLWQLPVPLVEATNAVVADQHGPFLPAGMNSGDDDEEDENENENKEEESSEESDEDDNAMKTRTAASNSTDGQEKKTKEMEPDLLSPLASMPHMRKLIRSLEKNDPTLRFQSLAAKNPQQEKAGKENEAANKKGAKTGAAGSASSNKVSGATSQQQRRLQTLHRPTVSSPQALISLSNKKAVCYCYERGIILATLKPSDVRCLLTPSPQQRKKQPPSAGGEEADEEEMIAPIVITSRANILNEPWVDAIVRHHAASLSPNQSSNADGGDQKGEEEKRKKQPTAAPLYPTEPTVCPWTVIVLRCRSSVVREGLLQTLVHQWGIPRGRFPLSSYSLMRRKMRKNPQSRNGANSTEELFHQTPKAPRRQQAISNLLLRHSLAATNNEIFIAAGGATPLGHNHSGSKGSRPIISPEEKLRLEEAVKSQACELQHQAVRLLSKHGMTPTPSPANRTLFSSTSSSIFSSSWAPMTQFIDDDEEDDVQREFLGRTPKGKQLLEIADQEKRLRRRQARDRQQQTAQLESFYSDTKQRIHEHRVQQAKKEEQWKRSQQEEGEEKKEDNNPAKDAVPTIDWHSERKQQLKAGRISSGTQSSSPSLFYNQGGPTPLCSSERPTMKLLDSSSDDDDVIANEEGRPMVLKKGCGTEIILSNARRAALEEASHELRLEEDAAVQQQQYAEKNYSSSHDRGRGKSFHPEHSELQRPTITTNISNQPHRSGGIPCPFCLQAYNANHQTYGYATAGTSAADAPLRPTRTATTPSGSSSFYFTDGQSLREHVAVYHGVENQQQHPHTRTSFYHQPGMAGAAEQYRPPPHPVNSSTISSSSYDQQEAAFGMMTPSNPSSSLTSSERQKAMALIAQSAREREERLRRHRGGPDPLPVPMEADAKIQARFPSAEPHFGIMAPANQQLRSTSNKQVRIATPMKEDGETPSDRGAGGSVRVSDSGNQYGRVCAWCRKPAPPDHDSRCALRAVRCRHCSQRMTIAEFKTHKLKACTVTDGSMKKEKAESIATTTTPGSDKTVGDSLGQTPYFAPVYRPLSPSSLVTN